MYNNNNITDTYTAGRSPFVLTRPGGRDTRSGAKEGGGGSKTKQKPKCK